MVFRRCRSPWERRAVGELLAGQGIPLAGRGVAGADLFGLWDLTATAGEALAGGAATGPLGDGGEVQLRGIAVAAGAGHRGLDRRLVCEVADSLRARGAARLAARPPTGPVSRRRCCAAPASSRPVAATPALRSARPEPACLGTAAGWWELEL